MYPVRLIIGPQYVPFLLKVKLHSKNSSVKLTFVGVYLAPDSRVLKE